MHIGGIIVEINSSPCNCAKSGGHENCRAPSGVVPIGISHSFELVVGGWWYMGTGPLSILKTRNTASCCTVLHPEPSHPNIMSLCEIYSRQ